MTSTTATKCTEKQADYIISLVEQISEKPCQPEFRQALLDNISKAQASAMITSMKDQIRAERRSTTAMDAHVRRMDAFRAERKAQAQPVTVLIVDHRGRQHDQVEIPAADWSPEANTGIVPVPGHSCPDGCCGLQADTATLERHPDGSITVEGCIV